MGFSKVIGPLSLSESGAVVNASISVSESVGGGSVAGVVKATASASAQVSAIELIDAGLELAEAKYPAAAVEIAAVKAIIDAAVKSI